MQQEEQKKDIAHAVLEKIENQHITPAPKWKFLFKDSCVWMLGVLSIFIGALSVSVLVFSFVNSDWSSFPLFSTSILGHIVTVVPYVWILVFMLFIAVAYYNTRHTKKGYRYTLSVIILVSFAVTICFGSLFYMLGIGHFTEYLAGKYFPGYTSFLEKKEQMWVHPEEGVLAGFILERESNGNFQLEDFNGKVWYVYVENIIKPQREIIEHMEQVSIIGKQIEESIFSACLIRPWVMYGKNRRIEEKTHKKIYAHKQMIDIGTHAQKGFDISSQSFQEKKHRQKGAFYERKIEWLRTNGCETVR